MSPHPPPPHLTLDNFNIDSEVPEACPFVLTSPRSLEACRRTGVQVGSVCSTLHLFSYTLHLVFVSIPCTLHLAPCLSLPLALSLHLNSPPCSLSLQASFNSFINYSEYSWWIVFTSPY